jgi:hypothetical protein
LSKPTRSIDPAASRIDRPTDRSSCPRNKMGSFSDREMVLPTLHSAGFLVIMRELIHDLCNSKHNLFPCFIQRIILSPHRLYVRSGCYSLFVLD